MKKKQAEKHMLRNYMTGCREICPRKGGCQIRFPLPGIYYEKVI
jgi:hypothetical protein